uniref:Amun n=1 Tax=Glossina morsitans morsitans TaxID=37546 RepID=A0A1B0FB05_GLOMM
MTNAGKDTASFFENGTTEQFDFCYKLYPQVLKLKAEKRNKKPQELIRLDQWYQNELPKLIKGRGKDAHIVYDELVQTMKWKQTRGKFYPQLSYLVKVNTPRAVIQETKKAFRKLPNLEQAITALSNLKGVGTTMASALLAAASPDSAPFMADECLMAIPEIEGIDYTTKEYLNFVQHIQATVERLNTQVSGEKPLWSPHRVELALWAHYVANDLSPDLLDQMPTGKGGGGGGGVGVVVLSSGLSKANGNVGKVLNDAASEDTNDGDNDIAAGRRESHNLAAESETENENTNPTPQDGDSNFVSNDSTSQEPIIDENTTQTTATTTTDDGDGDAVTPLASDSESNMEPPTLNKHHNNNAKRKEANSSSGIATTALANASSNGAASAVTAAAAAIYGENSHCLRESEYEDESSNNSNSRAQTTSLTPLLINHNETSAATTDTTESTLSSGMMGQKRSLNCSDELANSSSEDSKQPDMKKLRGD